MKKYIAPLCEKYDYNSEAVLAVSFNVSDKETDTQLSNSVSNNEDWDN